MIETFEGRLGGGKSYTAVQRIIAVLASGGFVATNIKLMLEPWVHKKYGKQRGLREYLKRRYKWDLRDDQIIPLPDYEYLDFESRQDGKKYRLSKLQAFWTLIPVIEDGVILVVIDEAHFHFPQSGFRSIPNDVIEFLTLSRHRQTDIIFISQHIKNMWCQMSRLAQYRWEFRDLKKYGMYIKGNFPIPSFTLPWPFPHILQSRYDYDGLTLLDKKYDWHNSEIHECYTSPDLVSAFSSAGSKNTYKVEKGGLTMKEKFFITAVGAVLASLVWGIVFLKNPRTVERVVTRVITNTVEVARTDSAAPVSVDDSEYLCGFVSGTASDKLWTNKAEYRVGDLSPDGSVILKITDKASLIVKKEGGKMSVYSFKSKPKPVDSSASI